MIWWLLADFGGEAKEFCHLRIAAQPFDELALVYLGRSVSRLCRHMAHRIKDIIDQWHHQPKTPFGTGSHIITITKVLADGTAGEDASADGDADKVRMMMMMMMMMMAMMVVMAMMLAVTVPKCRNAISTETCHHRDSIRNGHGAKNDDTITTRRLSVSGGTTDSTKAIMIAIAVSLHASLLLWQENVKL